MFVNIPNLLTMFRILLAFPIVLAIKAGYDVTAVVLFFIAATTDFLDGYFARKWKQESLIGQLLDPIADKVIYLFAILAFLELGYISPWPVMLICIREYVAVGFGSFILMSRTATSNIDAGKLKNWIQFSIVLVIIFTKVSLVTDILIWFTALFTIISAFIIYTSNKKEGDKVLKELGEIK